MRWWMDAPVQQGEDDPFDAAMDFSFDLADELGWEDPFAFVDEDDLLTDDELAPQRLEVEAEPVEERALQLHRWGKRISGVSWSVGGDIAFVQYDKTLESTSTQQALHGADLARQRLGWAGARDPA